MPAPVVVNVRLRLNPTRRRFAISALRLLRDIIPTSDNKLYASGRSFMPIFPTTDAAINDALALLIGQLNAVINPTP